jgi:hypothetical protein
VTTYSDLIDHALSYLGGDPGRANADRARRAVLAAYAEYPTRANWSFLRTVARVVTVAAYSTGTVEYDHAGGSSERLVTLTGGTFPAWAADGTIAINDIPYSVASRVSGTALTLESAENPGEDVAAGATYSLFRDTYPLPAGVTRVDKVIRSTVGAEIVYGHPADWVEYRRRNAGPGSPLFVAVVGRPAPGGAPLLAVWPPPDGVYVIDALAKRTPRALRIDRREDGTATTSGTAVAGTGTAFSADMVGSVIRFAADPAQPVTGPGGDNQYAGEATVAAVASATALTIDAALAAEVVGGRYVVSDPADIDDAVAGRYLLREVERQCRLAARVEVTRVEEAAYRDALADARAADSRYQGERQAGGGLIAPRRLADFPVGTEFQ